jgi:diguanylate cyclase (GGDEF)-like protein
LKSLNFPSITLSEEQRIYLPVGIALFFVSITVIAHFLSQFHSHAVRMLGIIGCILFICIRVFLVFFSFPIKNRYPSLNWLNSIVTAFLISVITYIDSEDLLSISLVVIAATLIGDTLISGRGPAYLLLGLVSISRFCILQPEQPMLNSLSVWMFAASLPIAGVVFIETIRILRQIITKEVVRLKTLNMVSLSFGTSLEINEVITLISNAIQQALEADTYYVAFLTGENLHFELVYDDGVFFPTQDVPITNTLAGHVIKACEPLLLNNLSKDSQKLGIPYTVIGQPKVSRSWMGIPLIIKQEPIGLIAVASYKSNAFAQQDLEMMQSLAIQASLAIDNARHHNEVKQQSRQDSLTLTLNHGSFIADLEDEIVTAKSMRQSLALIMLDIDFFKIYNDSWGHLLGDKVLVELSKILTSHVKSSDLVGRWGGEEFAIALQNASIEQATAVAERIRSSMQELKICCDDGNFVSTPTISQGVAVLPEEADDAFSLIDLADKRLYKAKQKGRNQIENSGFFHFHK